LLRAAIHQRTRRRSHFALTIALAAWIGGADLLATNLATSDSNGSPFGQVESQFQIASRICPLQLCRQVSSRSPLRATGISQEEESRASEKPSRLTLANRPATENSRAESFSCRVMAVDHLIALPGTPPPTLRL
jgi:hypothetical protein